LTGVLLAILLVVGVVGGVAPAPVGAAAGWRGFDEAIGWVAPRVGFLAAEIGDGRCEPVHGYYEDERLAIASTFKLYVLAELARQVQAGEVAWDEQVTVREELRSMPSGDTAFDPAGTALTVETLALRMIRDSDNTATDHLIDRLGRERVEAAFAEFGHEAPELNVPLLLTRELFVFKMYADPALVEEYLDAPDDEQRRILADDVAPVAVNPRNWGHWVGPEWVDRLEWFASPLELCRLLAHLDALADEPELGPLRRILGGNRGGVFGPRAWPFAGFKGGYEAGVVNATWLLERADGRTFVVTAGFNDPAAYVNQSAVYGALPLAADLLARAP
jgi:beta-lactamase class A